MALCDFTLMSFNILTYGQFVNVPAGLKMHSGIDSVQSVNGQAESDSLIIFKYSMSSSNLHLCEL